MQDVDGLILAGGDSRRMAGIDKPFANLASRPLILHVVDRLAPQVINLTVSVNQNVAQIEAMGLRPVCDLAGKSLGPLSGILAAMRQPGNPWLMVAPTDMPLLPGDLVTQMLPAATTSRSVVVAHDGRRRQNTVMLVHREQADSIERYLQEQRSVAGWLSSVKCVDVDFTAQADAFLNVNTPDELAALEASDAFR